MSNELDTKALDAAVMTFCQTPDSDDGLRGQLADAIRAYLSALPAAAPLMVASDADWRAATGAETPAQAAEMRFRAEERVEGWMLVPVEPGDDTIDRLAAAIAPDAWAAADAAERMGHANPDGLREGARQAAESVYRAMIDAAPAPTGEG